MTFARTAKPQEVQIRMIIFLWVLMDIKVSALETEAISYLHLTGRETGVCCSKCFRCLSYVKLIKQLNQCNRLPKHYLVENKQKIAI